MKNNNFKKYQSMSTSELIKEIRNIKAALLNKRIDIANHKNIGIHQISEYKKNIARINTLLTIKESGDNDK